MQINIICFKNISDENHSIIKFNDGIKRVYNVIGQNQTEEVNQRDIKLAPNYTEIINMAWWNSNTRFTRLN